MENLRSSILNQMESVNSNTQESQENLSSNLPAYEIVYKEEQKDLPEIVDLVEDDEVEPAEEQESGSYLTEYCRICACAYDSMISIYDETGMEMQLEEKINNYLPITVNRNDKLPLQLCPVCVEKLNVTHDLIISCLDADLKFKCMEAHSNLEDQDSSVVKKKVVVMKLVTSNGVQLPVSAQVAKALQYLKEKKMGESGSQIEDQSGGESTADVCARDPTFQKDDPPEPLSELDNLKVAAVAEFCVISSGKDKSHDSTSGSQELKSKLCKTLGDNGMNQKLMEAVQKMVHNSRNSVNSQIALGTHRHKVFSQKDQTCGILSKKNRKLVKTMNFSCKECKRKFKDIYKLTVHKQIHKNGDVFKCEECGKQFAQKYSLQIHQTIEKGMKRYSCLVCGNRFIHGSSLETHMANEHPQTKPWCCGSCGKSFHSKNTLRQHSCTLKDRSTALQSIKCEICNEQFDNKQPLKEHLKKHSTDRGFACSQCPKKFTTQQGLDQHETAHRGGRPYQCGICFVGFIRKTSLTKHYKTHTAEKIISCKVCKATFPTVTGLLNHSKTHNNEEWNRIKKEGGSSDDQKSIICSDSHQCSVCNKFLSNKLSLSLHMRTHTGVKPYQCEECKKRFTQKPALTYHQRLHTGERPHVCRFCQKGFNSKVGKESHERIHTGERPYKCGQCGLGFRCSANLRQHTWIHSDRRPFACELCRKLFRRREALQVHMRIHTGERPYACPVCSRRFTQKGDMMKHTRSHAAAAAAAATASGQGITCHNCGKTFSRRGNCKMHENHCSRVNVHLVTKLRETSEDAEAFVLTQQITTKDESDPLKTIAIATGEDIPKYSDISIVPRDVVQEIEVEYETK